MATAYKDSFFYAVLGMEMKISAFLNYRPVDWMKNALMDTGFAAVTIFADNTEGKGGFITMHSKNEDIKTSVFSDFRPDCRDKKRLYEY